MSLVTVAIPTYKRDEYLKEALESVLAQTISEFEIVVSDNANSPETRELVHSYDDPRVSYAPLLENIGLHGNLTRCLHLGSGRYLTVLLDDDTMHPANLEMKLITLERYPNVGVVHSAFDYSDAGGKIVSAKVSWMGTPTPAALESGRDFIERSMTGGTRVCVSSAVVRRAAVAHLCHDPRDGSASDLAVWLRIATRWDYAFLGESLTTFRVHADSASQALGVYDVDGGEMSMSTLALVETIRGAKMRFLDEYGTSMRDRAELRRRARDSARTQLKKIVAAETLGERKPWLTAHGLYRAARIEPSLWWSPWSAILLASSVWGKELFDVIEARR